MPLSTLDLLVATLSKGELARSEIMDWIAILHGSRIRDRVEQMLSKMEHKSYQSTITKGLIRAGLNILLVLVDILNGCCQMHPSL